MRPLLKLVAKRELWAFEGPFQAHIFWKENKDFHCVEKHGYNHDTKAGPKPQKELVLEGEPDQKPTKSYGAKNKTEVTTKAKGEHKN